VGDESIVLKTCHSLGVNVVASDIDYCYRPKSRYIAGSDQKPPPIIVRFTRSPVTSSLLNARRSKRHFTLRDIGDIGQGDDESRNVYINESLTPFNRKLYAKARNLKSEKKVKYLWVRDGNIYVRKTDGSDRITIRNEVTLKELE
jgi:hypothetical protein